MRFIKQTNKQRKETRLVSNKFEDMLKSLNITIWLTFQSFFYFFLENMIKLMDIVENSFYELVFFFFFCHGVQFIFLSRNIWLVCTKLRSLNVFMPSLGLGIQCQSTTKSMRVKELRDLDLPLQGELNSTNKHNNYGSLSVLSL
jgi:hypothetical protein